MTHNFSHKTGAVLEVRPISVTDVYSGGQNGAVWVQSETSHFNKCRVRWDAGGEDFQTCSGDYSVGDRVAIVWQGQRRITDVNLNTQSWRRVATPDNRFLKIGLALVIWIAMMFYGMASGAGMMGFVLGVVGAGLAIFLVSRSEKLKTASLNAALDRYAQGIK